MTDIEQQLREKLDLMLYRLNTPDAVTAYSSEADFLTDVLSLIKLENLKAQREELEAILKNNKLNFEYVKLWYSRDFDTDLTNRIAELTTQIKELL